MAKEGDSACEPERPNKCQHLGIAVGTILQNSGNIYSVWGLARVLGKKYNAKHNHHILFESTQI